ncbi:MAG: hypothetical protein J1E60_05240 [Christensenellaceae bacterium]|nr:hypothetical protein [Christensenellaceae bacterium]
MEDWRLTNQSKYLQGANLIKLEYCLRQTSADHDHCEFCMEKFGSGENDLHAGYCTMDCYYWICEDCFKDFAERFEWHVVNTISDYQPEEQT